MPHNRRLIFLLGFVALGLAGSFTFPRPISLKKVSFTPPVSSGAVVNGRRPVNSVAQYATNGDIPGAGENDAKSPQEAKSIKSSSTVGLSGVAKSKEMQSTENKAEHENYSLDISQTLYTSSLKSPKDSYIVFAEKGAANAKMSKHKILQQAILGGCYVGFGGLLSLSIAGNIGGIAASDPGLVKMAFAALFPVNLLLILTTGAQLFTGNSATVAAARLEGLVDTRELLRSWIVSLTGNVIGCVAMAYAASYMGLLKGGTAALCTDTALNKCRATVGQTIVKSILCNWMVSLAVKFAGASNDLAGKIIGIWFPISTFVAIGLEHSIANLFILPAALLLKVPLTISDILFRNIIPVLIGNAIAGAIVVAGSYSYQFGRLGGKRRAIFAEKIAQYEKLKKPGLI